MLSTSSTQLNAKMASGGAADAQENQVNNAAESDLTELSWLTNSHMFGAKVLMSPLASPGPKHHNPLYHAGAQTHQHQQQQQNPVLPLANFNRTIEEQRNKQMLLMSGQAGVHGKAMAARSAFSSYAKGVFNRKKLLDARRKKVDSASALNDAARRHHADDESLTYSSPPSTSSNSTLSISPSLPSSPSASSSSSSSSIISPAASPPRCAFSPIKNQPAFLDAAAKKHQQQQQVIGNASGSAMNAHPAAPMLLLANKGRMIPQAGKKLAKPFMKTKHVNFKKYEQPMLNDAYKNILIASGLLPATNPTLYAARQLIFHNENVKYGVDHPSMDLLNSAAERASVNQPSRPLPPNFKFKNTCGMNKPPLTLSSLIFMAIQESKDKCLPVREIYEWIEDNFPFYQNVSNGGWKSSIRHNLSFSKCFKKMDRSETALARSSSSSHLNQHHHQQQHDYESSSPSRTPSDGSGRKRRAPNSTGTCWKVNPECRSFLIQTLKKSSFWFHNSKYYPNLSRYITNYCTNMSNEPTLNETDEMYERSADDVWPSRSYLKETSSKLMHHKKPHLASSLAAGGSDGFSHKKFKVDSLSRSLMPGAGFYDEKSDKISIETDVDKIKREHEEPVEASSDYHDDDDEFDEEEDAESLMLSNQNRLLKFVQAQQRELCAKNLFSPGHAEATVKNPNIYEFNAASLLARTNFKGQEAPKGGVIQQSVSPRLELSLSSSSSSLTSAFALLSSSSSSSSAENTISPPLSSSISPGSSSSSSSSSSQSTESKMSADDVAVNSDLEMEVASTLVGMKWFASRQQQQQHQQQIKPS